MKVKKHIFYTEVRDIDILGATLLSVDEARRLLTREDRKWNINWWLREPGHYEYDASYIGTSGNVYETGQCTAHTNALRPALVIRCNSFFNVGDIFEFDGKMFKIISPELAWMYQDEVGRSQFNENYRAAGSNIYKTSEARAIVDRWFYEAMKKE